MTHRPDLAADLRQPLSRVLAERGRLADNDPRFLSLLEDQLAIQAEIRRRFE